MNNIKNKQQRFLFLEITFPVFSQSLVLINYTNEKDVNSTVIEEDYLQAGTTGGLLTLNTINGLGQTAGCKLNLANIR